MRSLDVQTFIWRFDLTGSVLAHRSLEEGLVDFDRVNRRMHDKSWIVDNRVAVVGGRNVGDEYFEASDAFPSQRGEDG